jgi:hypothetical protein
MNNELYPTSYDISNLIFKFKSVGPNGTITKIIRYKKVTATNEHFYNLSLGDWDEKSGTIDFHTVSNNGDTSKILFTVAQSVLQFVDQYPRAKILIVGSTNSRTRLYQMAFVQHFNEIDKIFEIQGIRNGNLENFKRGINFDGFLIYMK